MQIFKSPNFNFVRWRWHAIGLSLVIVLAGLFAIATKGLPLGVEFQGGTQLVLEFEQPPDIAKIRSTLAAGIPDGDDAIVQQVGGSAGNRKVMIRVSGVGAEVGAELTKIADQVEDALRKGGVGAFKREGTVIVGPVVGEQLKRQGTLATILALTGILIYIALRFQFSFAVGAVVATIHDLLVTLAFLVFFNYDITLNVIAAILTITGYSVNDTIVVFDRVRENLRAMRRDRLDQIVNVAVNQTLARTIITAGLTLLSVLALYLFGGAVLEGFAFTMIVGIISGTYSTIFIAAAIAILWQGKKPLKGQPQPVTATSEAKREPKRRRRAS
jgi:preprotein translocase subunit SecF